MSHAYNKKKKEKRKAEAADIKGVRNKIRKGVKGYNATVFMKNKDGSPERAFTPNWRLPGKRGDGKWNPRLTFRLVGLISMIKHQEVRSKK